MAVVAGVDGCRGGWLMVSRDPGKGTADIHLAARWADLPGAPDLVCVDMPIGLADRGPRACDALARRLLGRGRASSVFPVPSRPMLRFATWEKANAWGKRHDRGVPRQSWGLIDKIRELDAALAPADQRRVHEAHPELVFRFLNDGVVPPRKREPAGRACRRALLERHGFHELEEWCGRWPRAVVAVDDVYDACACCLAAIRISRGEATRLPGDPPRDARGLRMEIWY